ncbi:hypothetical protein KM043_016133 [Ampulex compressa]|nr:hypothetical protein KM043_016133 [Ampulex compressa]
MLDKRNVITLLEFSLAFFKGQVGQSNPISETGRNLEEHYSGQPEEHWQPFAKMISYVRKQSESGYTYKAMAYFSAMSMTPVMDMD